jgi:hypothetical protein
MGVNCSQVMKIENAGCNLRKLFGTVHGGPPAERYRRKYRGYILGSRTFRARPASAHSMVVLALAALGARRDAAEKASPA